MLDLFPYNSLKNSDSLIVVAVGSRVLASINGRVNTHVHGKYCTSKTIPYGIVAGSAS